ncbi:hypothetical protein [Winogradskya humida]|uniref:Uncharacterized protein n=1 Tax=Winogradskya humida TaxID=113566 RepID=A0ABQ3ZLI5_9ACTN|nr:hypothetical protein [Actinoplanes humidus]GIE19364.1 hypothetical protein Ahu01nite_024660 [Actinoplanes humidus]
MELKSVLRRARLSLVASLFLGALLGGPAHSPAVAAAAQPASPLAASAAASLASSPLVASDGVAATDHAPVGGPASVTGLSLVTGLSSAAGLSSVNGLASAGFRSVTGHVPTFTGSDSPTGSPTMGSGAAAAPVRATAGVWAAASVSTGPGLAAIFASFVLVLLSVPAARSRAARLIGLVSGVVAGPRAPPAAA